jgi:hypothetical protein
VSDIDTGVVDSLKALDHERPIREADSCSAAKGCLSITMSGIEKAADFDDCGLTAFASAIRKLFSVPLTKSVLKTPKSR